MDPRYLDDEDLPWRKEPRFYDTDEGADEWEDQMEEEELHDDES